MGKVLTAEQIDSWHHDGFVSPIDIFSEDEASQLRTELEQAESTWPEAFVGAARNNAHLNLTCLDRIVHTPRLLDAVQDLIGPDILNYGTVLFIKEPHDPGYVSWHQDARYMWLKPHDGITAWLALSPSSETSGCMQMIPGSHSHILDHDDTFGEQNLLTRGQKVPDVDESRAVSLHLRPGQASFHSARVLRASQPDRCDSRRIGFAIQSFMPPDVKQTKARVGGQFVRGQDPFGHFDTLGRPERNMDPADVAARNTVNAIWPDILYDGAKKRRDY